MEVSLRVGCLPYAVGKQLSCDDDDGDFGETMLHQSYLMTALQ